MENQFFSHEKTFFKKEKRNRKNLLAFSTLGPRTRFVEFFLDFFQSFRMFRFIRVSCYENMLGWSLEKAGGVSLARWLGWQCRPALAMVVVYSFQLIHTHKHKNIYTQMSYWLEQHFTTKHYTAKEMNRTYFTSLNTRRRGRRNSSWIESKSSKREHTKSNFHHQSQRRGLEKNGREAKKKLNFSGTLRSKGSMFHFSCFHIVEISSLLSIMITPAKLVDKFNNVNHASGMDFPPKKSGFKFSPRKLRWIGFFLGRQNVMEETSIFLQFFFHFFSWCS